MPQTRLKITSHKVCFDSKVETQPVNGIITSQDHCQIANTPTQNLDCDL